MILTVLGSGTSVPHPRRSSSAYWLETASGTVLLDCSPSAIQQMAELRLDWAGLDAIWISHFHLDHFGGLAPYLFGIKHAAETRGRTSPLRIFGGRGLDALIRDIDAAGGYRLLEQRFAIEIVEVGELEPFEILPGVEAVAKKTPHTDASHAIHIRDGEATMVFTADTGFDTSITGLAGGVGLFVLECSFVRDKPVELHLELAEAMHLIRRAAPRRAMLTHFYPEWDDVDFAGAVAAFDPPCEVAEAFDGLRVEI